VSRDLRAVIREQPGGFTGGTRAAILDRLAMHAIRIDIDRPSYRQHVATERAGRRPGSRTPDAGDAATT
jgi:hypothetical protein